MKILIKTAVWLLCILLSNSFNQSACGKEHAYKPVIAVDLDGVLNNYTKYEENNIPEIKAGAEEFIKELHKKGYKLVLFTNRKPFNASKWLIENKLDKYFSDVTNVKPIASIYIDDRALNFRGDYNQTLAEIENFNVYWKK